MKTKIILKTEDSRLVNQIFDFIKSNRGNVIEYNDYLIVIEKNEEIISKIMNNKLFSRMILKIT